MISALRSSPGSAGCGDSAPENDIRDGRAAAAPAPPGDTVVVGAGPGTTRRGWGVLKPLPTPPTPTPSARWTAAGAVGDGECALL
eukprot:312925-Chlamydomonas_euryale.AAC.1